MLDLRGQRVLIDQETHSIYERLVSRSARDAEQRPFAMMKDVFVVAACLGARSGQFREPSSTREIFSGEVFNSRVEGPILAALAFEHCNDIETLEDPRAVIDIAQNWANGGIWILEQEMNSRAGIAPLYRFVDLILDSGEEANTNE